MRIHRVKAYENKFTAIRENFIAMGPLNTWIGVAEQLID